MMREGMIRIRGIPAHIHHISGIIFIISELDRGLTNFATLQNLGFQWLELNQFSVGIQKRACQSSYRMEPDRQTSVVYCAASDTHRLAPY